MTLPYERLRAVNNTGEFLFALLDPKKTPRVPKVVRQWARRLVKHYPHPYEMNIAAEQAPDLFEAPKDAVGRKI